MLEREDVKFTKNEQVGWEPKSAEARNVGRGNVSTSTGELHSPVYEKEAPITIERVIELFNETDIPFKRGSSPDVGSVAEFQKFAEENSEVEDVATALALLGPVASALRKNRSIRIRLIGRSDYDFRGARVQIAEPGKIMGLERARTVRGLLLKLGVKSNQMTAEGEQIDDKDKRRLGVKIALN